MWSIYQIPSKEAIYESLECQRIKSGEEGKELILKIMTQNLPNMERDLDIHVCKVHRLPNNSTWRIFSKTHYIKLSKSKNFDKERILERIKFVTYKGTPRRLLSYFQQKRLRGQVQRDGREKKSKPRMFYPAKQSFRNEEAIKPFLCNQNLRDYLTTRTVLQEMMKGILKPKIKGS